MEILQNSQESNCASCEFCKISQNTFCYRTPPVVASVLKHHSYMIYIIFIDLIFFSQKIFAPLRFYEIVCFSVFATQ